jgi:hypothetical protein
VVDGVDDAAVVGAGVAVAVVWAPPLLLITTPGETSVVDDVDPDVAVVTLVVGADWVAVLAGPAVAEVGVDAVASVVALAASLDAALVELAASPVDFDGDEPPSVAHAVPGVAITATPIPKAAARAPTRPM